MSRAEVLLCGFCCDALLCGWEFYWAVQGVT